jgi:hypothetical protein
MAADRRDLHRLGRQRLRDLGQESAGHERRPVGVAVHIDSHLAGHLVVEAGHPQPASGHSQHHAGEHRDRRAGRQRLRCPRDRIGEHVALNAELHGGLHEVSTGGPPDSVRGAPNELYGAGRGCASAARSADGPAQVDLQVMIALLCSLENFSSSS